MSRARPPEGIEIAALKKKQQTVVNFMATGTGTPWEDRGSSGTIPAFFKTAFASLFSPGKLVEKIRRPETVGDARALLIGNCVLWGLSGAIHTAMSLRHEAYLPDAIDVNTTYCVFWCAIGAAAAGLGCYLLFKIYNAIYRLLVIQEAGSGTIPDTLMYNVNAYALGPSFLCLIPVAGPPLALVWIFICAVAVGQSRLKLKPAAAIIDAILGYLAVLAIAAAVFYGGRYILNYTTLGDAITFPEKPTKAGDVIAPGASGASAAPGATP
jgi:hypothetical protein